ncbi:hypothetical protein BDB00DRAFT_869924 [Zychaea mexicana]|uniref:uncharacterized protein n=1 Tax=Zychaea mexicana TaxID=64656 RepID=UPI0022FEB946|nr:uncharacterized protein BDB00DRAFT_869924 [Zychaea mexicana]KAI9496017.1 hypothetical protein BDB00DRAFT_869924 [Zychaea mexicana]
MLIPTEPTPNLVIVKNVAPSTSEKMLTDFFSFCGRIDDFALNEDATAFIMFERPSAAKTAILLNNATVNGNELAIEPYFKDAAATAGEEPSQEQVAEQQQQQRQESKTKSGIMAEILGAGYKLTDPILQAATDFDKRYGVWSRVEPYWNQVDQKMRVGDKVQSLEDTADHWLKETPMGQKVQNHLVEPIASVHSEAKRIANQQESGGASGDGGNRAAGR